MKKYRIVKRGDTETYIVQERMLLIFWVNRVGAVLTLSLDEARLSKRILENENAYNAKARKKLTVVE